MSAGTLYFDSTAYGAQYAVEYSYDSSTFYINSVKVKLTQLASVWWAFNLTVQINNTTISSGSKNHFVDTFDWYDLNISGSDSVTDTVNVTLSGSAIHNASQFNVASPTTQTVTTGSSGGGGDSGDTSGYKITISQGEGIKTLFVHRCFPISVAGEVLNGDSISPDHEFDEITVEAEDGYKADDYPYNDVENKFPGQSLTFPFKLDNIVKNSSGTFRVLNAGNASIVATASPKQYKLSISAGTGVSVSISRTKSLKGKTGPIGVNDPIYHFDELKITFAQNTGYNIATHTVNGKTFTSGGTHVVSGDTSIVATASVKSYKLTLNPDTGSTITVSRTKSPLKGASNKTWTSYAKEASYEKEIFYGDILNISFSSDAEYKINTQTVNGSHFISGTNHTVDNNLDIVTITELSGIVHIYNDASFENYLIYIYDGGTWVQCLPYIYDGTKWSICS